MKKENIIYKPSFGIIILIIGFVIFLTGLHTLVGENYNYDTKQMESGFLDLGKILPYDTSIVLGGILPIIGIGIMMFSTIGITSLFEKNRNSNSKIIS